MAIFCQEEREESCDSCYEITVNYCDNIVINPGIAPGYDSVYLQIIDKFLIRKSQLIEIGIYGFTIDTSVLPDDFFNPYAGKFELYLSTDVDGLIVIPMNFDDVYNCIILTIEKNIDNDCC